MWVRGLQMSTDDFWSSVYSGVTNRPANGRFSTVRLALLFGMVTVALALIVPPMIDASSLKWRFLAGKTGIDYTTTATSGRYKEYTLQRSILQRSPSSVCIIDRSGERSGDC
jgi:hypothetical protein